ncbi:ScyD/ScyE family protein [Streptomyces sp. NBC_00365]|uniref:ScyD/ScyE family protein n=1 Tax=Streptomyces sp. NBC_00365 TaxID=2975726 RepID=UPI00224D8886|nr:ScyD/ScyE family protein [Streptomyces sp. NBC_00365]MCX5096726.1 ScyD/ScyE family protein [Streptomyces sp. NBC_00365]
MPGASTSWARAAAVAAIVGGLTATAVPGQAAPRAAARGHAPTAVVVVSGLHNPRDVQFQADGSLLVAEAGSGPDTPCTTPGTRCFGFSGSVYRVKGRTRGRVVTGLPSEMGVRGDGSTAVNGAIQAEAAGGGTYRVVYGLNGTPGIRAALGAGGEAFGTLSTAGGTVLGDLAEHEGRYDPDSVDGNNEVFSNPHHFVRDGKDFLVTDAAANDLIRVHPDGTTTTEFVFPNNTLPTAASDVRAATPAGRVQAVPTGIVRGRDGAFYLADMGGMIQGLSRIWRYVPGSTPTVLATGLTDVTDLDLDPRGNLVALSYGSRSGSPPADSGPGSLTRVDPRTGALTTIDTGGLLKEPAGLAVGRGGDIYVTNHTLSTDGELLKFPARR